MEESSSEYIQAQQILPRRLTNHYLEKRKRGKKKKSELQMLSTLTALHTINILLQEYQSH